MSTFFYQPFYRKLLIGFKLMVSILKFLPILFGKSCILRVRFTDNNNIDFRELFRLVQLFFIKIFAFFYELFLSKWIECLPFNFFFLKKYVAIE